MITCGTQIVSGSTGGGASAPAGTGVVTASGGAFVDPVASAATTRATLGLGTAAVAALSDATPIVESGSGSAGTSGDVARADHVHPAAGGSSSGVPLYPRLATGFTDSQRFARASVSADAVGGTGKCWFIVGYLASSTAATRKVWCFQTTTTAGWSVQINSTTVQMLGVGININGAGTGVLASLGVTVTAAAAFCIAIEQTATHLRTSVNGGAVVATPYTGTLTAPTSGSTMGIGADHSATGGLGFIEGRLAECSMLNSAIGDAALQAFASAASTSYSVVAQLSSAQRALLLYAWCGCDGGAVLRTGNGVMSPNGNYTWSQPV
jgi:hypothetical protein